MSNKGPEINASLLRAVFKSGLLVGSLDILAAFASAWLQHKTPPERVLQYISSAVYGPQAYSGNVQYTSMGLLFHYLVALGFTLFFYLLYPTFGWLRKNKILAGLLYGFFMWAVMSQLVLPLTQVPPLQFTMKGVVISVLILTAAIGIPLAYLADKFYYRKNEV